MARSMISGGHVSGGLLLIAIASGTLSDRAPRREPVFAGGYRVLAGDFHVHPFPSSASPLAPWDLVIEAGRQGLDVIAVAGQNEAYSGRVASWFARTFGGPIVLPSEEVHTPGYHMIVAGIQHTISWRLPAARAIDETHRQGGVALAAHPVREAWPDWDAGGAIRKLDGAEVLQPISWFRKERTDELHEFFSRAAVAAIASSDYHGMGPIGICRTYVFVKDATEQGVLEAIRAHRTLVLEDGAVYGDPALGAFARALPPAPGESFLAVFSRICAVPGLLLAILWKRWHP